MINAIQKNKKQSKEEGPGELGCGEGRWQRVVSWSESH